MAEHLSRLQLSEPVTSRGLAVYSLQLIDGPELAGPWQTLDEAEGRGEIDIREKGAGHVPHVIVENLSRRCNIFILAGELVSGGKQDRAFKEDVALRPGQQATVPVYCVEKGRWRHDGKFSAGGGLAPQSIREALAKSAPQSEIWDRVRSANASLGSRNATDSLAKALASPELIRRRKELRDDLLGGHPAGTTGYIFVYRGAAVGAELFGDQELARRLLPKLIDAYAVDCVLIRSPHPRAIEDRHWRPHEHQAAVEFYRTLRTIGSRYTSTPGTGRGVASDGAGKVGRGVCVGDAVAHYGLAVVRRPIIRPTPRYRE